jgi:hypothetical protein
VRTRPSAYPARSWCPRLTNQSPTFAVVTSSSSTALALALGLGLALGAAGVLLPEGDAAADAGTAEVVKSSETGCAYRAGWSCSTGWLIQATDLARNTRSGP